MILDHGLLYGDFNLFIYGITKPANWFVKWIE